MLPLILPFLPLIPNLVRDVEGLFGKGQGVTKKAAVTNLLGDAINGIAAAKQIPGANSDEMELIGTMIDAVVAYFNKKGWQK